MIDAETRIRPAPHVAGGTDPSVLAAILDPSINLAVWQRGGGVAVGDLSNVGDIRFVAACAELPSRLTAAMRAAGHADGTEALVIDINRLARRFATIMRCDRLDLRLEVIDTDACRKFHADVVTARLIVSYAGPGTQWLSNDNAMAVRDGTPVTAVTIAQLDTGDVAMFKGRLWAPDMPIIHRSPPITGTGMCRLVLVINVAANHPVDPQTRSRSGAMPVVDRK